MYTISASRGPPAFVQRKKNFSKELAHDSVADASHSRVKKKEFIITPFIHHCTTLPIPQHNDEHSNEVQPNDFWGRKGVIKMDTRNEDRCSHMTIPPSTMMTLAMELCVSNRGKASRLFREGRLKSQNSDCSDIGSDATEESNLINMWVVPEADLLSGKNTPSTASHLKPSLVNADFVIHRTSAPNTPSPKIPSWETKLEKEDVAFLESLTAADLVGSSDHVISYDDLDVHLDVSLDALAENVTTENKKKSTKIDKALNKITSQSSSPKGQNFESKFERLITKEAKENLEIESTPQSTGADKSSTEKINKLRPGHIDCLACCKDFERNKECFMEKAIKTEATHDLPSVEYHEPNLTAPSDINYDDPNNLNHPQKPSCISMSPEVDVSLNAQQIKAMQPVCDNADNTYKEIDNKYNEPLLSTTISCRSGHKPLTERKKTLKVAINNNSALNDGDEQPKIFCVSNSLKPDDASSKVSFLSQQHHNTTDNSDNVEGSPTENIKDFDFAKKDLSHCTKADKKVLEIEATSKNQSSTEASQEPNFAEIEVVHSETRGFEGYDLSLAAARSLSSSSLVSLSSLDSMSSASIQLSSYASGKTSAASCFSLTSDLQEHNSKCQGSFPIKNSSFIERRERRHSNNDLTKFSTSFSVVTSTEDVTNQHQRYINSNCSTKLNKHKVLQLTARSKGEVEPDSIRKPFGSVESQNKLRECTRRCYSSLELRRPRSVSPSRKVICQYTSHSPILHKKDDRKSPSGLIISQAVFQDEKDSTVATPILRLKNKNRICTKCKNKMMLCCCSSKRRNPSKSCRRESKDRICNVGDYSRIDKYVVVSSRSKVDDLNNLTESGKAVSQIAQESKPPPSAARSVDKTATLTSDKFATKQNHISPNKNLPKSSQNQVKVIVEPEVTTTATRSKEKCRITLPSLKQPPNNGNTSYSCSNTSENKTVNNRLPHNKLFSSSTMANSLVDELNREPSSNRTVSSVEEATVIAKSITGEYGEFGKDNFQQEFKSKIIIVNPNPRVNVFNGSHIALKQISTDSNTSSAHFNSRNNDDKAPLLEEAVRKDNAQLCMAVPLHKDSMITNQQTKAPTANHSTDSVVIDKRFGTGNMAYLSQGLLSQNRSLAKLENSSPPSSTLVKLIKSGPSLQGHSQVVVRQQSIESDRVKDKRAQKLSKEKQIRKETCQNSSPLLNESVVTEPQMTKMNCTTQTCKNSEVFISTKSKNGSRIGCQNTTNQNSSDHSNKAMKYPSQNDQAIIPQQKQEPPNKTVYSSHVSLSLQPVRKISKDKFPRSAADVIVTSSDVQHGPAQNVCGVVGDKNRREYPKRVHNWSLSVDPSRATSPNPCGVETSTLRLPPTGHKANSTPARPLAASPTCQTNRIVMQRRGSPSSTYNQINEDYEIGICDDGTRIVYSPTYGKEDVRDDRRASHVDCLREAPPHTLKDEEDFSGVVDEPMMKVKEIRAKYKGRDYENYAKPRSISSSGNTSRKGSEDGTRRSFTDYDLPIEDTKESKTVVARQVMDLFKGALDVENELTVFEEETRRIEMSQNQQRITPVKRNGPVITIIERTRQEEPERETLVTRNKKSEKLIKDTWSSVQSDQTEMKNIRRSVEDIKSESNAVASFDESLDQFYDVFNDLTS